MNFIPHNNFQVKSREEGEGTTNSAGVVYVFFVLSGKGYSLLSSFIYVIETTLGCY